MEIPVKITIICFFRYKVAIKVTGLAVLFLISSSIVSLERDEIKPRDSTNACTIDHRRFEYVDFSSPWIASTLDKRIGILFLINICRINFFINLQILGQAEYGKSFRLVQTVFFFFHE